MQTLLNNILNGVHLSVPEYGRLLKSDTPSFDKDLYDLARSVTQKRFGRGIYLRGLIEISNICRNDCLYCGIRRSNHNIERYRLSRQEILSCCAQGYRIGFRTFVLQGGEDTYWRGDRMNELIREIRSKYPDCAITLSLGEMSEAEYQALFDAGANRYLLRHETSDPDHYASLHPPGMYLNERMECLKRLKTIGFQVGTGVMIGSPGQTLDHLAADLHFIAAFQPEMIGVGPFLPQKDTPFGNEKKGNLDLTIRFIALCRLVCPNANIPATTAIASSDPNGRIRTILSGANVVMPNLSPLSLREKYALYDGKAYTNSEAAEGVALLQKELETIDYQINWDRGDFSSHTAQ